MHGLLTEQKSGRGAGNRNREGLKQMRKNIMWRLLATLFAIALAASACGGSDSSDDSSASSSSSDAEETETTVALAASGESLLDTIKSRGTVNCGVSGSAVAFSELQADGSMAGFDADYCRVVAAVSYTHLTLPTKRIV